MAVLRSYGIWCYLFVLMAISSRVNCCPELRICFPEAVMQVPCESDNGPKWVLEASTTDCGVYLNCFNGIGVMSCCPVGMYFNPIIEECDDEANVECNIVPPPCPEETTLEPEESTSTTDEQTTETTDATETSTDDADSTTLENSTTEATETTTVSEGPDLDAVCTSQPSDETTELPYPDDCGKFVVCANQASVAVETCPVGLHFNPTLNVCDSPDHAECLEYVCRNNPDGQLLEKASVNSCRLHFLCVGNTTIERLCAPGTVYVPENGWCIPDDLDNPCEPERPPPPPVSVIEQCTEDQELSKIPHPEQCDVYYRCLNGRLFVRQCPPGLLFDRNRAQCNLEENAPCEL